MLTLAGGLAVFASALLIAVADALIKKTGTSGTFLSAFVSSWMFLICALYFIQILLALYIFINKGELAVYGNVFIVFYSILMVMLGVLFFNEQLSLWQYVGIALALFGTILLNSGL